MEEIVDEHFSTTWPRGGGYHSAKDSSHQKICQKKNEEQHNNTTGARMPPWLKGLVACFNCKPALPAEAGLKRPKLKMLRPKTSPDKTLTEVLATTGQTREDSPAEESGDFFKCRQCGCLPSFPGACSIHSESSVAVW